MSEQDNQDEGAVEFGNADTLDEIGERFSAPTPTDFSQIKLEGDEIPQNLRGKSVADVLDQVNRLNQALQASEEARTALKNSQEALAEARRTPAPVASPAPQPEPELNEEQLDALFQENPRKYHQYMAEQAEKRLLSRVQGMIAPVVGNTTDMSVRDAQRRYPEEFSAFGKEIQNWIAGLPDKSILAAPGAMDEAMDYLRGKNWKKFQEHLASKQDGGLDRAREQMGEETPVEFNRNPQPPANVGGKKRGAVQLDQTMKDIADILGVSYEDYAKGITQRDLAMMRSYGNR